MDELYKIQNVTYNATGGTLKNDKAVIDLTAQQNRLLHYLVLNAGQTLKMCIRDRLTAPRVTCAFGSMRKSARARRFGTI